MKIFFISLAVVALIGLSIGIGCFWYQKNYPSGKTAKETNWEALNYRIPFEEIKPQIPSIPATNTATSTVLKPSLPTTPNTKPPIISQNYLTYYQNSINNLNKISTAIIALQKTLLELGQKYESEGADVLPPIISKGINENTNLGKNISDFKNSLDNWSAANNQTTNAAIKTKTDQTIEGGKNFSQSASEFSDILGKILNSQKEDEINQLSQQLQVTVQKMNNDGNQLNKLFTELNNLLAGL